VCDNLDTHRSEGVVRLAARQCGIDEETLGRKGHDGVLARKASRAAFLRDQIKIWFSILVRKFLRRASFTSTADLKDRIERFIYYFNKTMAKPFKWVWAGRPLTA
jgi:hypothetical protein